MSKNNRALYKKDLDVMGFILERKKCIEKCGSLIRNLSRDDLTPSFVTYENVKQDLASLEIMLSKMRMAYGEKGVTFYKRRELKDLRKKYE